MSLLEEFGLTKASFLLYVERSKALKREVTPLLCSKHVFLKLNLRKKHARSGRLEGLNNLFHFYINLYLYIEGVKVILVFSGKNVKE